MSRVSSAFLIATALGIPTPALVAQETNPWSDLAPAVQIRLAVQAAPVELRDGATVQGWRGSRFITLREGANGLICMAPDPERANLEVSCHHASLEPFFARGRALTASGISGQERIQARWDEFSRGELPIPYGATNYILTGSGFDAASGEFEGSYLRWVIYTPEATSETTGIGTAPIPHGPWLMFPGTAGSHIMITPPRGGGA